MSAANPPCTFCEIACNSTPTHLLHSDEKVVAFQDIKPAALRHYLVIPKEHIATVRDLRRREEDYSLDFSRTDGIYATNNQFQMDGPRGFTEFRMLQNDDLFVRMDLPGVPKDRVKCCLDKSKKAVIILAEAPKEHKYDTSGRKYGAATGLVCECCEICRIQSSVTDGVLRLVLSKKKIDQRRPSSYLRDPQGRRGTDPLDPAWTGRVIRPHPNVMEGPDTAFESKQLQNGGLYLRLDLPGVPKDMFKVVVEDGAVLVIGKAPPLGFDSSGRDYGGKVALLTSQAPHFATRRIKTLAKNGVIRLVIPPV